MILSTLLFRHKVFPFLFRHKVFFPLLFQRMGRGGLSNTLPSAFLFLLTILTLSSLPAISSASTPPPPPPDSLRHWGFSLIASPSRALVMDSYQRKWQKGKNNTSVALELSYSSLPSDSNQYAADFGYPTLSLGLKYSWNHGVTMQRTEDPAWGLAEMVDYESRMGNALMIYGRFARPFYRGNRWEIDYSFDFGAGYTATKYNPNNNVDNELIGSHWNIYFGAGLHATYRVARQWGVRMGVDYWHLSNGALYRPNKGANFVGPSLGVVYYPYYEQVLHPDPMLRSRHFKGYWFSRVALTLGAKTLNEDWQRTQFQTPKGDPDYRTSHFKLYPAYAVQLDVMRRYALRWASGIGLDLFYGSYSDHVKELDEEAGHTVDHSPWSVGIAAKHEVFYGRLRLHMSLGFYLYRKMGVNAKEIEQPYYERIGLHYEIPHLGGLTVGANVQAHRTKADLTEIVITYPFLKW